LFPSTHRKGGEGGKEEGSGRTGSVLPREGEGRSTTDQFRLQHMKCKKKKSGVAVSRIIVLVNKNRKKITVPGGFS